MKKSYYAIIPANVRYDDNLPPNAKLLYGEITALCNEKGYCWANNNYFADLYNVKKETVSRWIGTLVSKGYIKIELIYSEGSKEVKNRYIYINQVVGIDEKINTYCENNQGGIDKKINTPIDKKVKDNNTVINNTFNNIPYVEVIDYLNKKTDKSYKNVESNKKLIRARWNEGYRLDDFRLVIDYYSKQWKGKTFSNGQLGDTYLRPSTLFNNKFDERLNEAKTKTIKQPKQQNGRYSKIGDDLY